jgi:hypothetical protein
MSNWRQAAQIALGREGGVSEVSEKLTSENPPSETRMNAGAGFSPKVSEVSEVFNPPLRINTFFEKNTTYTKNSMEGGNRSNADSRDNIRWASKTPHKPQKPPKPISKVSEVYEVPEGSSIPRSIVAAVNSGAYVPQVALSFR